MVSEYHMIPIIKVFLRYHSLTVYTCFVVEQPSNRTGRTRPKAHIIMSSDVARLVARTSVLLKLCLVLSSWSLSAAVLVVVALVAILTKENDKALALLATRCVRMCV